MRRSSVWASAVLAVIATLVAVTATAGATNLRGASLGAAAAKSITLHRCGYANTAYGKDAVYPWQMTCSAAEGLAVASEKSKNEVASFGPGFDGGIVLYGGQKWACTGQMGGYECGFPYRPYVYKGVKGYKGPFTKAVEFTTCKIVGAKYCGATSPFSQPQIP